MKSTWNNYTFGNNQTRTFKPSKDDNVFDVYCHCKGTILCLLSCCSFHCHGGTFTIAGHKLLEHSQRIYEVRPLSLCSLYTDSTCLLECSLVRNDFEFNSTNLRQVNQSSLHTGWLQQPLENRSKELWGSGRHRGRGDSHSQ